MKKELNVQRVINAVLKEKNTIINLNAVKHIINAKMKVAMIRFGVRNNLKNDQMNLDNITMKLIDDGVLKTQNIWQNGPEQVSTLDSML